MPGAWTVGIRMRPKAVRVIRERERRDKWQSVWSWMRIGAPYRCHSFVCGHTLSCRAKKDQAGPRYLFVYRWNLRRWRFATLLSVCRTRVWECDSLWILGDVLTAGWRAIVLSLRHCPSQRIFVFSFTAVTRLNFHSGRLSSGLD